MTNEKLINLLRQTQTLIKHQREKEILKGESFNVFSILRMESKENETHSAFLAELLNPDGSHLKGNTFLRLFLQTIDNKTIDPQSAKVKVEHYIGPVDLINKTGGRIDIYIWDNQGNTVSIENKIFAGDQQAQIERYVNYKKEKNTVYYLTLHGYNPSKYSKGKLVAGEDFYNLSYKEDITNWLQVCFQIAADNPILRESIRQYIILLKKLTHTMEKKEQEELYQLILNNYEEASVVKANFDASIVDLKRRLRNTVIQLLTEKIGEDYQIIKGERIENTYAQVWIIPKRFPKSSMYFGIESFSGRGVPDPRLFIGIINMKGSNTNRSPFWDLERYKNKDTRKDNRWIHLQFFEHYGDVSMNLSSKRTIKALANSTFFTAFATNMVDQIIGYLKEETRFLVDFLEQEQLKENVSL